MGSSASKEKDVEYNMLLSYVKEWEGNDQETQGRIQDFHKSIRNRSTLARQSSIIDGNASYRDLAAEHGSNPHGSLGTMGVEL